MPRLPTPGGDIDTWGGILNDYLAVEHDADGSHKAALAKLDAANIFTQPASGEAVLRTHLTSDTIRGLHITHSFPSGGTGEKMYRPIHVSERYKKTDGVGFDNQYQGIGSTVYYGDGINAIAGVGTVHAVTNEVVVERSGDNNNEHAAMFGVVRYDIGTGYNQTVGPAGRGWLADFGMIGPIDVQPGLLNGITMFVNNHYNGSPSAGSSANLWLVTKQGTGPATDATHDAAPTYPVDMALGIAGTASAGSQRGFETGIKIGGTGSGWQAPSRIGTGLRISDWESQAIFIDSRHASGTGPGIYFRGIAGQVAMETRRTDESATRWYMTGDGVMNWGGGVGGTDVALSRGGADVLRLGTDDSLQLGAGIGTGKGFLQVYEQSAEPGAAPADTFRLFALDNGAGKTQICVKFPTGVTQVLATEA